MCRDYLWNWSLYFVDEIIVERKSKLTGKIHKDNSITETKDFISPVSFSLGQYPPSPCVPVLILNSVSQSVAASPHYLSLSLFILFYSLKIHLLRLSFFLLYLCVYIYDFFSLKCTVSFSSVFFLSFLLSTPRSLRELPPISLSLSLYHCISHHHYSLSQLVFFLERKWRVISLCISFSLPF